MAVGIQDYNFNNAQPAAPAGYTNVQWQADPPGSNPRNISAYVQTSGTPGTLTVVTKIALSPGSGGPFTVAHGLGTSPTFVLIQMTSSGAIWLNTSPLRFDATNLYLVASDGGITGVAYVWTTSPDALLTVGPGDVGNFTFPHGLSFTPALVFIEMDSGGAIVFQSPGWDATNLYLTSTDSSTMGRAIVFKAIPNFSIVNFAQVSLSPSGPGNFTVAQPLGTTPKVVLIRMTSLGAIWEQSPTAYDASNLYLTASHGPLTGYADCWA